MRRADRGFLSIVLCVDEDPASRHAAFSRVVVPEIGRLHGAARTLTREPAAAEDLVQDTLVRAYRALCRFDGRYPRAWLLTILRNSFAKDARKRRPVPTDEVPASVDEDHADALAFDGDFAAAGFNELRPTA